mgnify:CR=1 FL=1
MAVSYQKIKINSKITILESELILLEEKIKSYEIKLQKISNNNKVDISRDEKKIEDTNAQIESIQTNIDKLNQKKMEIKKQLNNNPINNEEELDKERVIFINETDRILKKRNDIDTEILNYEVEINEKIYNIKLKIISQQEKIKTLKTELNNIKKKNLAERKKVLDQLAIQKINRKKFKEKLKNIDSIISKKNESLVSHQVKLYNLPNKKREANKVYYDLRQIINDKKNENLTISEDLRKKMENNNANQNDAEIKLLITYRDTNETQIKTLESKPEYDIYSTYNKIDQEKIKIQEDINIIQNELKELNNHKKDMNKELKEVHSFNNHDSSQYKKYKEKIFESNNNILKNETMITNYEKDLIIFNTTKEYELNRLLSEESRSNLRWQVVNDRINNFYQRESKEMEIEYNNLSKLKNTLTNEIELLNTHKQTLKNIIQKKISSSGDTNNYLSTIKIKSEIIKIKKNIVKKKEDINTYQTLLKSL